MSKLVTDLFDAKSTVLYSLLGERRNVGFYIQAYQHDTRAFTYAAAQHFLVNHSNDGDIA